MSLVLTQKDLLELKYWLRLTAEEAAEERAMSQRYLAALRIPRDMDGQVLEIGTGPLWGLLPYLTAERRCGIDPLYPAYYAAGILEERRGIFQVDECFERWDTNETFDAIVTTNALDHGEMGFYLLPKIARLLKPGGRLYLHVHLRTAENLNLIHDHALCPEDLDRSLAYTDLIEERREVREQDLGGAELRALLGVWRRPA